MDNPFVILFIGIAVVVGLIIGLRLNAFLAMLAAALVVSFLAPGEWGSKVERVAAAFGSTAGGVGIVIALAAVIGKCLMESGAADRIVQAFLKLLGEKRAALALTGSGFVLAIPVFFDTVFYLLVPLARSLYRNTRKNYLLYIMAIAGGGAVTHALVPPTPGPLLMAQQLGVDLGTMIGVGLLVGLPCAVVGLLFSVWQNRRMPIPMRPLPGDEEADAVAAGPNRKLPGLLVSLLPILLPVALIGLNTGLETKANGERAGQVTPADLVDPVALRASIDAASDGPLAVLKSNLPAGADAAGLVASINAALAQRSAFATGKNLSRANLAVVEHENRLVLEKALPETALARHQWNTPNRRAADLSKIYGNANFALLLSAVIAVLLYVRMRRPGKAEFGEALESALMSGGVIILITSAGGAFGAMLGEAGIGPAIERLFPATAGKAGLGLLALGFAISALLKIAQGSTTVAVITASAMIAAMMEGLSLGYHPVYLATAIGGGGLVGSWMNDSGFWIYTKMSGLTESESLQSWTPLLSLLGITAFVTSLLLAVVLPLV
jgi:H+/gluconate symporter-like permease